MASDTTTEGIVQVELIERAQNGDRDAFSALVRDRLPRLYGVAGLITGSRDAADDAVQETLLKAWRDLPRLREPDRFDAWLHRLLVNACHDHGRRLRRRKAETPLLDVHQGSISDAAQLVADRDELDGAFRRLDGQERAVIVLRHYLGLSTAEAAAALGMREGTRKSKLHRAMNAMSAAIAAERRRAELRTGERLA